MNCLQLATRLRRECDSTAAWLSRDRTCGFCSPN